MPTEQRVIASKPKIGAKPIGGAPAEASEAPAKKGKKKLLLLIVGLVVVLAAGGAYWFLMGPGAAAKDGAEVVVEETEPEKGAVMTIEAVSINLAGGHYLRLGLGLQLTAEIEEEPDTARALDLAIALYSGRTVEEVSGAEGREALKDELLIQLDEAYEGEVMDVYLMDYVTQ